MPRSTKWLLVNYGVIVLVGSRGTFDELSLLPDALLWLIGPAFVAFLAWRDHLRTRTQPWSPKHLLCLLTLAVAVVTFTAVATFLLRGYRGPRYRQVFQAVRQALPVRSATTSAIARCSLGKQYGVRTRRTSPHGS